MPSPRRQHVVSTPTARLARAALTAVLSGDDLAIGPRLLVIVAPRGDRILADLGQDVHEAGSLARRLAAAEARATQERLRDQLLGTGSVAIAGIDRVGRPDRQRVLAAFLDVVADRGHTAFVTLAAHPASAALDPMLESRLSAGLIITVPAAENLVLTGSRRLSLSTVIRTTARLQRVSTTNLLGQSRHRSIVRSRSIAMYVARTCTGASLGTIGMAFGGRDHTTAMRSVRSIERRLAGDPALAGDVRAVITALQTGGRTRPA